MKTEQQTEPDVRYSVPPASGPVMLAPGEVPAERPFAGCGKLTAALAQARDRCKTAEKDKVNEHHNYRYTSADGITATAREALYGSGLALIPQRQALTVLAAGAQAVYALDRTFILSHESGEFTVLELNGWPVIPGNGRPLDKAFAIALTSSMSYMLQGVLHISRGEADDMGGRDDRKAAAAGKQPKPSAAAELLKEYRQRASECLEVECLKKVYDDVEADRRLNPENRRDLTGFIAQLKQGILAAQESHAKPPRPEAPAPGRGGVSEPIPF